MCDPEDEPRDIAWCLGTEAEAMGLPARQGKSRHGSGDIKRQRVEGRERVNVLLKTQDSLNVMSLGGNARKYAPPCVHRFGSLRHIMREVLKCYDLNFKRS